MGQGTSCFAGIAVAVSLISQHNPLSFRITMLWEWVGSPALSRCILTKCSCSDFPHRSGGGPRAPPLVTSLNDQLDAIQASHVDCRVPTCDVSKMAEKSMLYFT